MLCQCLAGLQVTLQLLQRLAVKRLQGKHHLAGAELGRSRHGGRDAPANPEISARAFRDVQLNAAEPFPHRIHGMVGDELRRRRQGRMSFKLLLLDLVCRQGALVDGQLVDDEAASLNPFPGNVGADHQ